MNCLVIIQHDNTVSVLQLIDIDITKIFPDRQDNNIGQLNDN